MRVEQVGEIELRIEAVELGAFDQRVHRGGAAATGIGAGEQPVLAADRDAAQGSLGRVVVERQAAIIEAADEGSPAPPHVAEGGGQFGFARELAARSRPPIRRVPRRSASIAAGVLVGGGRRPRR